MQNTIPVLGLLPAYRSALVARGYRPRGITKYMEQLRAFANSIPADLPAASVTTEVITRYQEQLAARCSSGTVGNALTCIRSFCRWCVAQGIREDDPTLRIHWPHRRRPAPRALQQAQLRRLITVLDQPPATLTEHKRFIWARNRRAILLMLFAGLRISEVAALRWREVDMEARTLLVVDGKGGKDRTVPLHPLLLEELRRVESPRPTWAVAGQCDGMGMNPKSLAHTFERWLPSLGIEISAHQLRHSFASELLRNGADLRSIQELLGHASLATTQRYLMLGTEQLHAAVNRLPRSW